MLWRMKGKIGQPRVRDQSRKSHGWLAGMGGLVVLSSVCIQPNFHGAALRVSSTRPAVVEHDVKDAH
jgi:hypothetical protein